MSSATNSTVAEGRIPQPGEARGRPGCLPESEGQAPGRVPAGPAPCGLAYSPREGRRDGEQARQSRKCRYEACTARRSFVYGRRHAVRTDQSAQRSLTMSKRGWPHVDEPEAVGRRLKEARLAAGLSQRELAFPGCTAVYICRIERGDRVPSLQVLRQLARKLGVDEDYLATGQPRTEEVDTLARGRRRAAAGSASSWPSTCTRRRSSRSPTGSSRRGRSAVSARSTSVPAASRRRSSAWRRAGTCSGPRSPEHPSVVESLARAYSLDAEYESAIGLLEHALGQARERGEGCRGDALLVLLANTLIDSGNPPRRERCSGTCSRRRTGRRPDRPGAPALVAVPAALGGAEHRGGGAVCAHCAGLGRAEREREYAARAHHLLAHVELEAGTAPRRSS